MTLANDTVDLLATGLWGEVITIRRNTPTYGDTGAFTDSWATVSTPNADIQPVSGDVIARESGQDKKSTHRIFLPNGTAIKQGDRIRPSGWSAGDDEYEINSVLSDEGHVEVLATQVKGHG